jgi:phosphate transport system ATP-binding protein
MGNIKISIKDLSLKFGGKKILKNIHLDVPENKILALVGPSGCGKTSLLRCMNRMHDLHPKAKIKGTILLDEVNILGPRINVTEIRRKVGMVFQRPNPFPKSIEKNIAFGLEINGEKNIAEKVESALRQSFLWEEVKNELTKSATQLSLGQQQRLCIARAIAIEPSVILMDEPCSSLDPHSTQKIEELMLELKKKFTIIVVTHNLQQAQRIADYTAFMYLGNLIEVATTHKIFSSAQYEITQKYVSGSFG